MSGGAFDYYQYHIGDIIDRIEEEIEHATCERPPIVKRKFVSVRREFSDSDYRGLEYLFHYDFKDIYEAWRYFRGEGYEVVKRDETEIVCTLGGCIITCKEREVEEYEKDEYGNDQYFPDYTEETIAEFRKGVEILKKAKVYAQRIDWLISGDDGEDSFHMRLKEELDKLNNYDIQR